MIYNMSLLDFGNQLELSLYASCYVSGGFRCDSDGVIFPVKSYSGIFEDVPFEEGLTLVKDLDEVERRKQLSLQKSLSRTRSTVYTLAQGEKWEWFLTFTFSSERVDRYSYDDCVSALKNWLVYMRQLSRDSGYDAFKYIIVPEQHKDGAWHFHGLFAGDHISSLLRLVQAPGHDDYRVEAWSYGFSTATPVKDPAAVSTYITKYLTKDLVSVSSGRKRYWCSRNLNRPDRYLINLRRLSGRKLIEDDVVGAFPGAHVRQYDTPYGKNIVLRLTGSLQDTLYTLSQLPGGLNDVEYVKEGSND